MLVPEGGHGRGVELEEAALVDRLLDPPGGERPQRVAVTEHQDALTGGLRPYVPGRPLAAILGISALLALVALALPTRRALRARPIEAIGIRE